MELKFSGAVSFGDSYRSSSDEQSGAVHIGGVDVIDEIFEHFKGPVKVEVNGEVLATGVPVAVLGWGYSSWTPMDSDELKVGDFDLLAWLMKLKTGDELTMVVTEQPAS